MGLDHAQPDHPGDFVPIFHRFSQPFSDTTKHETPSFTWQTSAASTLRRKSSQKRKIEIFDPSIFSRFYFCVSRFYFSCRRNRSVARGVGDKVARFVDPKVKSASRKVKWKVKSGGSLSGAIFGGLKWRLRSSWIGLEIGVSGDWGVDFWGKSAENRGGIFGG